MSSPLESPQNNPWLPGIWPATTSITTIISPVSNGQPNEHPNAIPSKSKLHKQEPSDTIKNHWMLKRGTLLESGNLCFSQ